MHTTMPRSRELLAVGALMGVAGLAVLDALVWGWFVSGPAVLAVAFPALLVGAVARPTTAALATIAGAGLMTVASQIEDPHSYTPANDLVFFLVVVGAPALIGAAWSGRERQIRALRRLSEIRLGQRSAQIEAARLEERTRLAGLVQHDVVEAISAIAVQAEGAARSDPAGATGALHDIENSARATLERLRSHIGALREPDSVGSAAPREPPPVRTSAPTLGSVDLLAALALVPLAVESVLGGASRGPAWANVAASLALAVPVAWRRRAPLPASAAFAIGAVLMSTVLTPVSETVSSILPMLLCAHAVGAQLPTWRHRCLGFALLSSGAVVAGVVGEPTTADLPPTVLILGLAVLAGAGAARSNSRIQRLDQLIAEIDRDGDTASRLATAQSRHAVARDLHDSVAAAMTIVCIHADAARRTPDDDGRQVRAALETITVTVRGSLAELRRSLAEAEPPAAGRLRLDEVVRDARQAGLTVSMGRPELPKTLEPLAARVVREALVNAARHAPGAAVMIDIQSTDTELRVTISDDGPYPGHVGPGGSIPGTGHGLRGLGEIVNAAGGELRHGPLAPTGFRVEARVPTRVSEPA